MIINYSLLSYGRVYNPVNWYYNPLYVVNRIYYIVNGTAFYKNNIQLKPGHLYVFKALPDFKVHQDMSDPVDHVFFDFITYKGILENDFIEIDENKDSRLKGLTRAICEDFKTTMTETDIAGKYLEILIYYLKDYLISDNSYSDITRAVLHYIHNNPAAELSVSAIADKIGNNVNHIIRCFKKDIGITPHNYINMVKTNLAIAYIKQGLSCTEIAETLGFSSISAFSYFFKHATGSNYNDYRTKLSDASYKDSIYYNK